MSTLKYVYKLTRIEQCIIAGIGAWLIALLSNGPLWFNTPKLAAAICIFCSCLGASLFHYGRRADIYKLKHYDLVIVKQPYLLMFLGSIAFMCSLLIAKAYLPVECLWIAMFNFLVIMLYSNFLDKFWPFKNLVIAFVCVTPIMMGWFSGHRMHPIVPYLIIAITGIYLAREVMKDVVDREANKGKRFTMVMYLGVKQTLQIAGLVFLISASILAYAIHYLQLPNTDNIIHNFASTLIISLYLVSIIITSHLGWQLVRGKRFENCYRYTDGGITMMMLAILIMRANL